MTIGQQSTPRTSRRPARLSLIIVDVVLFFLLSVAASLAMARDYQFIVVLPALSICLAFVIFCLILASRVRSGVFGEVGFIFLGFVVAYSVIPAANFLLIDFDFPQDFDALNFSVLNPRPDEIALHLWRHFLFAVTVIFGYLAARGSGRDDVADLRLKPVDIRIVGSMLMIVVLCIGTVTMLSSPVENYYEHYTRFDALPWFEKRVAYLAVMIKSGAYYVALALMFADYKRFRWIIPFFVVSISAYELVYSLGSRIETLSILLATLCLYHLMVRKIRLREGLFALGGLLVLFTAVEFFRGANFDLNAVLDSLREKGPKLAAEFGAVFYTSFHLYSERLSGTMPRHEWPMLFNDFLTAVPFFDHIQYNSQYWYAQAFFPTAIVPPQTMGPIADSAIWGGEVDLALRGVFTGLGFGWLARWALGSRNRLFPLLCYTFLFATCVISLKYSLIYLMSRMLQTLVPTVLVYFIISRIVGGLPGARIVYQKRLS
ncbi:hypothetical protein [Bradyrhizobium sp. C9]|uniref:hypothetical protein n=1 Tax=Bradyrhizobium sp. C9 TaxID=142585 RepID=UPI0011775869|nr:hypothetical protein [Bradyrhizobium sp. C9]